MSEFFSVDVSPVTELERPTFGQFVRQLVPLRTEQLEECLRIQEDRADMRLGEVMVDLGLIDRCQVRDVLESQARWVAQAKRPDLYPLLVSPSHSFLSRPSALV